MKIRVRPWQHPTAKKVYWRATYIDSEGRTRDLTRADRAEAIQAASAVARTIHNGMVDLTELPPEKIRMVRAILDLSPTWADVERWGAERRMPKLGVRKAAEQFIAFKEKESSKGLTKHLKSMRSDLFVMAEEMGDETPLARVRATALAEWLDELDVGAKRRKDYRAACVQLWTWARRQELIVVSGEYTEPEKLPMPEVTKKDYVRVLSKEELVFLFKNVRQEFLPWLALGAFSGLRSGEMRAWNKPALDWSMVKLDRGHIDLPASISKTGRRRLVPISPTLAAWLKECKPPKEGPILREPAYEDETGRLGRLLDEHFKREEGWPMNCLRHSYGSHRVAQTQEIGKVAIEMGNSEKIIKDHYLEVRTEEEAEEYFNVLPGTIGEHNRK
ncbi:tyrosine-type recombinase/integrase [Luteolibacter rhizosphaerae]|uniref:tyrosine-type recombinase/integrase n=1 Tax=Luteolibacter rhizosphaerae TaxID=2989719 RepID=UPI002223611D|nr:site-specific integrase [Luteolibacter rhizosphaerae]